MSKQSCEAKAKEIAEAFIDADLDEDEAFAWLTKAIAKALEEAGARRSGSGVAL